MILPPYEKPLPAPGYRYLNETGKRSRNKIKLKIKSQHLLNLIVKSWVNKPKPDYYKLSQYLLLVHLSISDFYLKNINSDNIDYHVNKDILNKVPELTLLSNIWREKNSAIF